ncbi:MAG: hypothetical protein HQL68_11015 [Magnetococcales bacterium]|nr:hypothetical protein [Magnetococcales bacterium]
MSFNHYEKSFYLKAFHGTTLAISVAKSCDLNPQAVANFTSSIAELSSHGCRVVLFWQKCDSTSSSWHVVASLFDKQNFVPVNFHKKGERKLLPQPLWQEGFSSCSH